MPKASLPEEARLELATAQWAMESPGFDQSLFQMASALTMLGQAIEIEFRALSQNIGGDLSPGDLRILLVLRRSGPPYAQRPVNLMRHLLVTSGAMTKQIARLEAKKLVRRSRIQGKRGWRIQLTDAGGQMAIEAMRPDALPLFSKALGSFAPDEQAETLRFLRKLIGRMDRLREADVPQAALLDD